MDGRLESFEGKKKSRTLRRLLEDDGARTGNGRYIRWRRRRYPEIVGQRMSPQVAVPAEDLAAGSAMIRLDVRVREKMGLEVAPLIEAPGADGALVRRFLHVQNLVDSQRPALTESLAALGALERFLFTVDIPVKKKENCFSLGISRLISLQIISFSFS